MSDAFEKRIKKHIIGKPHRFLAVAPLGFEQTLINELNRITTKDEGKEIQAVSNAEQPHIVGDGKVEFTAKLTEAWKIVAYSRIANRVLMHIADFKAENFREFEKKASEIPWELFLDERRKTKDERNSSNLKLVTSNSININVTCKHSRLYHSDAIAERLQKIIGEKNVGGTTRNTPPQNIYVHFLDDRCTIWQDLAGEELYKRGFERFVNEAPLKETIAAAMLFEAFSQASNHGLSNTSNDQQPTYYCLLDLMAGSGTFSLEAACIANKIIPGACRDFALKHQPAFKEATWNYIVRQENSNSVVLKEAQQGAIKIITSDISERAIEIIKHNVECSPLASIAPNGGATTITPQFRDFFSYTAKEIAEACPGDTVPVITLNPPYGKRLDFDAPKLYTKIGRKLTELARELKPYNKTLTVAILAPKDDTRNGAKYTCTANLLHECAALSPEHNPSAKFIVTSHGGFSLNAFFATL